MGDPPAQQPAFVDHSIIAVNNDADDVGDVDDVDDADDADDVDDVDDVDDDDKDVDVDDVDKDVDIVDNDDNDDDKDVDVDDDDKDDNDDDKDVDVDDGDKDDNDDDKDVDDGDVDVDVDDGDVDVDVDDGDDDDDDGDVDVDKGEEDEDGDDKVDNVVDNDVAVDADDVILQSESKVSIDQSKESSICQLVDESESDESDTDVIIISEFSDSELAFSESDESSDESFVYAAAQPPAQPPSPAQPPAPAQSPAQSINILVDPPATMPATSRLPQFDPTGAATLEVVINGVSSIIPIVYSADRAYVLIRGLPGHACGEYVCVIDDNTHTVLTPNGLFIPNHPADLLAADLVTHIEILIEALLRPIEFARQGKMRLLTTFPALMRSIALGSRRHNQQAYPELMAAFAQVIA